ncbi:MAG: alkane 1-monooxygenase [Paracoccaceae bacterium]
MIPSEKVAKLSRALPFWVSLSLVPVILFAAKHGGWTLILPVLASWGAISVLDIVTDLYTENADIETTDDQTYWYEFITLIWFPIQFFLIFGLIWYVSATDHLSAIEKICLFFGVGIATGTVGITYSHELMHRSGKLERWLGDLLLASVLYSHFRSEHLLVHHTYVGTPRDAVTARYNEGFQRFFPRVLRQCWHSAFRAEKAKLAKRGRDWMHPTNPFWRYWAMQLAFMILAMLIGGWAGLGLFIYQACIAIWQLELVNYIEHYGLTRKHLGDGKYEPAQPRHSWNAAHRASNWLLINLQRHSDHHSAPGRRFPLLQNYSEADAPQLPYGYPLMTMFAMVPPLWLRMMNPKVRKWRTMYYPEITDWSAYKAASNPMPRR